MVWNLNNTPDIFWNTVEEIVDFSKAGIVPKV